MTPSLLLVNGLPGTGKSTLASKLSHDLSLPMLGKDMLKEWLFDNLNLPDKNISGLLGKSSSRMLYVFMEDFLSDGRSVIAESAYHAAFARDEIKAIIDSVGANCIEIYCTTDAEENRRRFVGRIHDGVRHAVHTDAEGDFLINDDIIKKYAPLDIGKTIQIDTTNFGDAEYQVLSLTLKKEIA